MTQFPVLYLFSLMSKINLSAYLIQSLPIALLLVIELAVICLICPADPTSCTDHTAMLTNTLYARSPFHLPCSLLMGWTYVSVMPSFPHGSVKCAAVFSGLCKSKTVAVASCVPLCHLFHVSPGTGEHFSQSAFFYTGGILIPIKWTQVRWEPQRCLPV